MVSKGEPNNYQETNQSVLEESKAKEGAPSDDLLKRSIKNSTSTFSHLFLLILDGAFTFFTL